MSDPQVDTGGADGEKTKPMVVQAGSLMLFGMIIAFIVISQQKASRGVAFGHEASYIALIGFLISLAAYMSNNNMIQENFFGVYD